MDEDEEKEPKVDPQQVFAWLDKNWQGERVCPICKKTDWAIGDTIQEIRQFRGGNLILGGPLYPVFLVTCTVCGYTILFNAIVAGLVEQEPEKKSEEPKPVPCQEKETEDEGGGT
jgi:aconitase B